MNEVPLYCDSAKIFPSDFQDREKDLFDASDATDDRRDERSAGATPSDPPPAAAPSAPLASDAPTSGRPPPGVSRS